MTAAEKLLPAPDDCVNLLVGAQQAVLGLRRRRLEAWRADSLLGLAIIGQARTSRTGSGQHLTHSFCEISGKTGLLADRHSPPDSN